jgi:hypothetical protein
MELLRTTTQIVKIVESTIQLDSGGVAVVKDYYDETDKIIDTEVLTKDGYEIDDPAEYDAILEFMDQISES